MMAASCLAIDDRRSDRCRPSALALLHAAPVRTAVGERVWRHPGGRAMKEQELMERRRLSPPPGEDFWIFAYGSLMWNPGFTFLESHPALVRGYHRSFCVESTHYRGTKERPGLVLGLDRGGACRGRAYKVCRTQGKTVTAYLHERELRSGIYQPRWPTPTPRPPARS